jgi:S1-C subfamily serine protease
MLERLVVRFAVFACFLATAATGATGCEEGPPAMSPSDKVRARAAADFGCEKEEVHTKTLDSRTRVATGCGQTATYVESCEQCLGDPRCNCTWVLNSRRGAPTPVAGLPPPAPKASTKSPTVRGTCFAIARSGHLLTAEHVVRDVSELTVQFPGGPVVAAKVASSNAADDVAILKVDIETPDYLPLSKTSALAHPGTKVFTFGFPVVDLLGAEPKFTDGSVSALSGRDGDPRLMQMTIPIQPGNSGGPVVTETGFVIGIVTSTAAALPFLRGTGTLPQGINWAVKADAALAMIKKTPDPPPEVDREGALERTRRAVCAVSAKR